MAELSRPPGTSGPKKALTSQPISQVRTAARAAPLPKEKPSGAALTARLADGAADTALNVTGAVRDRLQEFLGLNRFLQYRILVVSLWLLMSLLGVAIAWPKSSVRTDENLGARLVLGPDPDHPVFVISNEGETAWRDVTVVVNGQWQGTAPLVESHADLTLTPKQLVGANGKLPPSNLRAVDLILRTRQDEATLLKDGQIP